MWIMSWLKLHDGTDAVYSHLQDVFGKRDFMPQSYMIEWFAENVCGKKLLSELCGNLFFVLCGFDEKNLNMVRCTLANAC